MSSSSFGSNKIWSDSFTPKLNQLAEHLIHESNLLDVGFNVSTKDEDRKLGVDMWFKADPIKLAYRVRGSSSEQYFLKGFTLRTSGFSSELDKVKSGTYADYALYALEDNENIGDIQAGVLLDMKSIGAQLNQYPELLSKATNCNGFIDFPYHDFWIEDVVVGYWGLRPQRCQNEMSQIQ